jgi:malate/lactate dehydrogenase
LRRSPSNTRNSEGLRSYMKVLHGLVNDVCLQNPRGILLIASNPVDVLTYAAWKWSGLPAGRVIGSGTSLDTSRFRRRVAEHYGIASANVHAYVIGEHGDSQVPVLSSARVAGFPLSEFSKELGYRMKRVHLPGLRAKRERQEATLSRRRVQRTMELELRWFVSFAPFCATSVQS